MTLIDDLKARFPDLDEVVVDKYLSFYENNYQCYYGAEYGLNSCDDEVLLNLFAHLITVANDTTDGESIKQVSSESVGSVSTSYIANALDNNDKFWTSSIYGQTYKLLTSNNMGCCFV